MAAIKETVVFRSSIGIGWFVPEDCTSVTIECLSGTGAGGSPGDGSSYSRTNNLSVTPGTRLYILVGGAGGRSYVNKISFAAPSSTAQGCLAVPSDSAESPAAYNEDLGVGDIKYNGGVGADPIFGDASTFFGGTGGSAGPAGRGGNGGNSPGSSGGAGGAANGGGNASGTTAGVKRAGATGGDGGAVNSKGTVENIWTDIFGTSYGLSGGSGGAQGSRGPAADPYGGGGFIGGQGLVVITYTRRKPTSANTVTRVIKGPVTTEQILILPAGTTRVTFDAVGGGSAGFTALSPGTSTSRFHGGGGGSYANTVNTTIFPTGSFITYAVANSPGHNIGGTNTYATIGYTGEPTSPASINFSVTAKTAFGRFSVKTSIGQRVANGGDGGLGYSGPNSATVRRGGGGGGAAFWFDGGAGGGTFNPTATPSFAGGGGGGAATGASPGTAGSAGGTTASPGATGGAGGNAGTGGGPGGAGGTSGAAAGNGTNGGGGGGAFTGQGQSRAGDGAMYNVAAWYIDTYAGIVGPVGPGGGGGGANNTGQGGVSLGYGGGGGGGRNPNLANPFSEGNTGVLIITYTFEPNVAQVAVPYTFGYIID
jgi:hypothetical protein